MATAIYGAAFCYIYNCPPDSSYTLGHLDLFLKFRSVQYGTDNSMKQLFWILELFRHYGSFCFSF